MSIDFDIPLLQHLCLSFAKWRSGKVSFDVTLVSGELLSVDVNRVNRFPYKKSMFTKKFPLWNIIPRCML